MILGSQSLLKINKNREKKEVKGCRSSEKKISAYFVTINTHVGLNKLKNEEEKEKFEEEAISAVQVLDDRMNDFIKFMNKKENQYQRRSKQSNSTTRKNIKSLINQNSFIFTLTYR